MSLLVQELHNISPIRNQPHQNDQASITAVWQAFKERIPFPGDVQVDNGAVCVDHLAALFYSSLNNPGSKGQTMGAPSFWNSQCLLFRYQHSSAATAETTSRLVIPVFFLSDSSQPGQLQTAQCGGTKSTTRVPAMCPRGVAVLLVHVYPIPQTLITPLLHHHRASSACLHSVKEPCCASQSECYKL